MAGGELIDIAIKAGIALSGGIGGLFIGVWKWGRFSAKAEQAQREEMRIAMASHAKTTDVRIDLLVDQFKESFEGIRRQIDEHRFYTEKDFMKKEDFKDFREEYREDMRDLKASIAGIARTS